VVSCCVGVPTGVKPPKRSPFHLTWDKSLFLKQRRQELKSILEELDFYQPVRLRSEDILYIPHLL